MTQLQPGKLCPLIGEDCRGLECSWYTQVRGTNPQSGEEVDEWGCAVTWLPMLLIENSLTNRQTGAAVESFRNESVNTRQLMAALTQLPKLQPTIEHDD
tara:strand:+ start:173 stop:469 length:297 start_codon:yes stop_codon:yes gene_type:complete